MYLFTIHSKVNPKSKARRLPCVGGAYVNCYISLSHFSAAEKLAKPLIKDQGWIPVETTDAWKLKKTKLKTKEDKQYYSVAVKHGYCLVFHTWPKK